MYVDSPHQDEGEKISDHQIYIKARKSPWLDHITESIRLYLNNAIQMLFLTVFNVALFCPMFVLNYIVRNGTFFLMIHLFEITMTFFLYFNNLGLENNF